MRAEQIVGATGADLLARLHNGEISATEVVRLHLERLREVNELTNAVAWFEDDRVFADAGALDRAFAEHGVTGPLHGLPITVKDWIDVEGFICQGRSPEHKNRRPTADATVVSRLRRAGAIVLAKTKVTSEAHIPRVVNPLDPDRTPGGSSGGEGVVVAMGASAIGIGSDSGGSIRMPAAWCGVYGFKPTAGLVPTTGHFPRVGALNDGRTQIGPMSRSVEDLELALRVMAGPDWRDAGVAPVPLKPSSGAALESIRFVVLSDESEWQPQEEISTEVEHVADRLEHLGASRVSRVPEAWLSEALDITNRYWKRSDLSGDDADLQLRDWDRFRSRYLEYAEQVDMIVMPVTLETAPRHRQITGQDFIFMLPASLTGSPAISIPAGTDKSGLPIGVQLVGRPWEDHRVLAAARAVTVSH